MRHSLFSLILVVAYALATPWFLYRWMLRGKRCQDFSQRFLGWVPRRTSSGECIWFHAVSVGEVNLLSTIIDRIRFQSPDLEIVISSTTKTGYQLAVEKYPKHRVFYSPIDFSWSVNSVLNRVRPSLVVLSELELWPNLIGLSHRQGIPVAVINGRMSNRSYRGYRRFNWLFRPLFQRLSLVCAQSDESAERFRMLGTDPRRVTDTGSIKFDGVAFDRDRPETRSFKSLAGISDEQTVFLAGSTQAGEERLAAETYARLKPGHPHLRLIIVPRHIERAPRIAAELKRLGLCVQLRSRLEPSKMSSDDVLIVDTIGELGYWWGLAHIGFVGGSFGDRGGQNMLEPVALSVATCFGPNTRNFRQIVELLLQTDAATQLSGEKELFQFVEGSLNDPFRSRELGRRGSLVVARHQGATGKTVDYLLTLLSKQKGSVQAAA